MTTIKPDSSTSTPEAQFRSFIARFDTKGQKRMRAVRATLRQPFSAANELGRQHSPSTPKPVAALVRSETRPVFDAERWGSRPWN